MSTDIDIVADVQDVIPTDTTIGEANTIQRGFVWITFDATRRPFNKRYIEQIVTWRNLRPILHSKIVRF